eukprot:Platyproteum_vivax@DN7575_c0_g1_i1.p1
MHYFYGQQASARHRRRKDPKYKCEKCGEFATNNKAVLQLHIRTHEVAAYPSDSTVNIESRRRKDPKYKCEKCGEFATNNKAVLQLHIRTHEVAAYPSDSTVNIE